MKICCNNEGDSKLCLVSGIMVFDGEKHSKREYIYNVRGNSIVFVVSTDPFFELSLHILH